ncbi:unnamed protein product [Effrenium voratum]|uniref:Uncharacterized protein n=1 Tax=Effrenium voratum TaxID=2562239 RepID=A0AA36IBU8_9DINO|nr:unnamed protein product [Effrenium voratum]
MRPDRLHILALAFQGAWALACNRSRAFVKPPVGMQMDGCWDDELHDSLVFHLHVPKVAGCSMVEDVTSMIGRTKLWSNEVCYSHSYAKGARFQHTLVMFRQPRAHVISMYEHCKTNPLHSWFLKNKFSQPHNPMPDTLSQWIHAWKNNPTFGSYAIDQAPFACYNPINLQTRRLTCSSENDNPRSVTVETAVTNMQSASVVGLVEAYHESICLVAAQVLQSLPSHCHCEDSDAWQSFKATHEDHGNAHQLSLREVRAEVMQEVDALTDADSTLYKAALERFLKDIEAAERRFSTRILCPGRRQMLQEQIL